MKPLQNHPDMNDPIKAIWQWSEEPIPMGVHWKTYCKTEVNDFLHQIKLCQREHSISPEYLKILYAYALAYYVECLVETELETKMAKWGNRLLSYWVND